MVPRSGRQPDLGSQRRQGYRGYGNYTDYVRAKKGLPPLTDEEREAMANDDADDEN